jgi:hypothetical protein
MSTTCSVLPSSSRAKSGLGSLSFQKSWLDHSNCSVAPWPCQSNSCFRADGETRVRVAECRAPSGIVAFENKVVVPTRFLEMPTIDQGSATPLP